MAVTLTPTAVARIRSYLAETPGGIGLRFGVRKSGCSGFAYVVDIAKAAGPDDTVFETDGVAVRVDAESLPPGGRHRDRLRGPGPEPPVRVPQPRVAAECGCGESFTTDDQAA
ncbi:HesB/IscA family protein [Arenimonas daejeonensis]|uniref:HesB/IscA family protein n=1 Tax=Arenimonas daejeonensis TaxID=370777 RepID=UPI001D140E10|nr:iron-sulfur cluster assembly accessory protein [Arenimonas daejeonensis]